MSGDSGLRIGGWVPGRRAGSAAAGPEHGVTYPNGAAYPVIESEPVGTITEALLPAAMPDPGAAVDGDDDDRPYRGRRRLIVPSAALQRVAAVALLIGVTLIGTSVLAGLLLNGDETGPAPAPTPPERAEPSPDGDLDSQRLRPSGSPSASPADVPPADQVTTASHQAEGAGLGDHAQVVALDGAAGGQAVRLSGNRAGTFVSFAGIEVAEAGPYEVTIAYLSDQDRTGTVSVSGGGSAVPVSFPSRDEGGGIGSVTVSVELTAGSNTIRVSSDGGAPLVIDQITVTG